MLAPGRVRVVAPIAELQPVDVEELCVVCRRLKSVHGVDSDHRFVDDRPPPILANCEDCDEAVALSELTLRVTESSKEWICARCRQNDCMRTAVALLIAQRNGGELPAAVNGVDFDDVERAILVWFASDASARFRPQNPTR